MLRQSALIAVLTIVVPVASPRGQAEPGTGSDLIAVCEALDRAVDGAKLVFTGRAQPPMTVQISGEAEIEQARENLVRIEAEVKRLRASLDPQTRLEREREFAIRIIEAKVAGNPDWAAAVPIVIGKATQHAGFDFLVITE